MGIPIHDLLACKEIKSESDDLFEIIKYSTPLESSYKANRAIGGVARMKEFEKRVIKWVDQFREESFKNPDYRLGFMDSVKRLEFLDRNLIGDEEAL